MQQADKSASASARSLEARVWDLLEQHKIKQALSSCEQLNTRYPDYASGWHTASQLALKLNNPAAALAAAEKALLLEADNTAWLLQKALCLAKLGQAQALAMLVEQLSTRPLASAYQCSTLALLLTQLGQREQAIPHYEQAIRLKPEQAQHYYNLACLQRSLGMVDEAETNFNQSITLQPTDYEACKIRSELRTQTAENNHVDALEKLLAKGIDDKRGKAQLCFALAKELEDLGESERAFHYLKLGADTRRGYMKYNVQGDLETMAAIRRVYGPAMFTDSKSGDDNAEAIFVMGMPRTGTTLVERVIGMHSDVHAAGELTNFAVQMVNLVRGSSAEKPASRDELVSRSAELDFRLLGKAYIESTRPATGHTSRFTDKMPLNYLYAGPIHLALPRSRIINLKRHPLDTCYAVYKQLFMDAYPFSYTLEELGQYYVAYHRLIEHWHSVMPGVIYSISYEALVADLEGEAIRLLEFCGLEWQPQCLNFHENPEASTTASTVQIRQPVYQSSVGKWRNYEAQLAPLIRILDEAGIPLDE